MVSIRGYISSNFTKSLLTVFLPIYFIVSLVYIMKVSALTAQINITLSELISLYTYFLPDMLFYTLPFSFIAALANTLARFSTDNELIALHALGLNSDTFIKKLILPTFLFSILLFAVSFIGMPLSNQTFANFKMVKRAEANFNLIPGKVGQKFGDYYIYIEEKKGNKLYNLVIYNQSLQGEEQFFSASIGEIVHQDNTTYLKLTDGYGYTYSENTLRQTQYKELKVYDQTKVDNLSFKNIFSYWSQADTDIKVRHRLLFYIFASFIPLLSLYLIASYTMINPRYQTNRTNLTIFIASFGFYIVALGLESYNSLPVLFTVIITIWIVGKWLFKKRVERYF